MRSSGFWADVRAEVRDDLPVYALLALHVAIALACGWLLDRMHQLQLLAYASTWLRHLSIVLPSVAMVGFGLYVFWARPESPLAVGAALVRRHIDARVAAGLLLMTGLMIFMGAFTSLKNLMSTFDGFRADAALADIDRAIHGVDPWLLFDPALWSAPLLRAIEINYSVVWMIYAIGTASGVALFVHDRALRLRFMACYALTWAGLGNGLAAAVLSAGPAFFHHVASDAGRFDELRARLSATAGAEHSAAGYQQLLWTLHERGEAALGSGISAFPSLHVAVVTLYCLFAYELNRRLGHLALAYLVIIALSSVYLGWHYAVDGYASIAAVLVIYFAVKAAFGVASRARAPAAPGLTSTS